MKVYLVCKYHVEEDREQNVEYWHLNGIEMVTVDKKLAEMLRDAFQYREDKEKRTWVYKVEEFDVYGKL